MRLGKEEKKKQFEKTVELFGIGDILERSVHNLSGGEKQRVALARTLVLGRRLLLLDEPFSALDTVTKWDILRQMKKLHSETGITVIHVTHDIDEALFLSDHLAIMSEGRIMQSGATEHVYENPRDVTCAKLVKKENMFMMQYDTQADTLSNETISFYYEGLKGDEEYLVHIPPEDIILSKKRAETSARNVFQARVNGINITSYGITVNLDINNARMTSFITKKSASELKLSDGDAIFVMFKSGSIEMT